MIKLRKELLQRKEFLLRELTHLNDTVKIEGANKPLSYYKAKNVRFERIDEGFKMLLKDIISYNAGVESSSEEVVFDNYVMFLEEIDEFRTAYLKAVEEHEERLKKVTPTEPPADSYFSGPPPVLPGFLNVFYGGVKKWTEFKTAFDCLIHFNKSLSEEKKMLYLKSSVKGEAAVMISEYSIAGEHYQAAYEALHKEYHNPSRLVDFHLQSILKFKNHSFTRRAFLNVHETAVNSIKALNFPNLPDFLLFQLCYSNLNYNMRQEFDLMYKDTVGNLTTETLLDFVRTLLIREESKENSRWKGTK